MKYYVYYLEIGNYLTLNGSVLYKTTVINDNKYKVFMYKSYKHLLNALSISPNFLESVQNSKEDLQALYYTNTAEVVYLPKPHYIFDEDFVRVPLTQIKEDIAEIKEKYYYSQNLQKENDEYVSDLRLKYIKSNKRSKQYTKREKHTNAFLLQIAYDKKRTHKFRAEPMNGIYRLSFRGYCREMHYGSIFRRTKELGLTEQLELELEEETGQRIVKSQYDPRAARNLSNLPDAWDIEPTRSNWRDKNWKKHSKAPKQWAKHKKRDTHQYDKWGQMSEWLEEEEKLEELEISG